MVGAFISLALSRIIAKLFMGVQLIEPETRDPQFAELIGVVYRLARAGGLNVMPQVGIFYSQEVNAFATGPSRRRSLVAVSSGLLNKLTPDEIEAVLAHEITHITNGDMVTMTLIQGIVNAFVMFLARILAFFFSGLGKSRDDSSNSAFFYYNLMVFAFQILFMLLGAILVAWFSRKREFRADAGGARLAGTSKMIAALRALQNSQIKKAQPLQHAHASSLEALKISSSKQRRGLFTIFSTHPPLEERIKRLQIEDPQTV
jgi:heat shock protein HtpX